ncbi:prolipoprotein diacylglyceryl transferase [Mycolicibacterium grossiae]|uniref:Phosphatidylglycerol--prolipoprotein diacylglyceryl transferase n=1 Tax=Mycolicibacterium grossiae TaxID=1552759 RepID=A0A1E8PY94_9MYCO|nr:prolipoprotein diacylglyceryl transferase [Mycolicibacterium grossiae]OFJ50840.1 prolipoprotein diacylglyceryl transferase [Mycolicibacterium grossiae]QEM46567.1 prolipoprotein diacylglyceryl transferase [Mycolicibacterium grossiae]
MTTTVLAYLPSPAQGVWHLGPIPIRAYALCILVGIVVALIIGDRRWSARGGEPGVIYDIALWAVPFGLIGGRLYHVITDWTTYFGPDGKGFGAALRIWDGGLGIWGAVALGGVGAWIACRRRGIPLPAFGDAIAPGIVLAQAIGRLGNYFNQELYGRPTTLPWGLEIYERRNAAGIPDSLNGVSTGQLVEVVHPTFLYELLWNLLVFAALLLLDRRFRFGHGRLFALYVAGYCVGRFWIELMRSDYATTIADTGIRVNTFTSTFVFIGAVVYVMVAKKGREAPETLRGHDAGEGAVESATEHVGAEATAAAATTGLVAAAVVAGDEDRAAGESPSATSDSEDVETAEEPETAGESEAAAEADELVEQVRTAPSEDIAEAEDFAETIADVEAEEHDEPAAEAEELAEQVATASSEDIAVATEFADEMAAAEASTPDAGLGAVEGEDAEAAEQGAPEAHLVAAEGAAEAEAIAEAVADETTEEADDTAEEADDTAEEADDTDTSSPEEGLGSVEGEEVVAAQADAAAVHEAASAGAVNAEQAAEPASDVDETDTSSPEEGLGSVEGEEVVAAQADAAAVHEAANAGAADAENAADDVSDGTDTDTDTSSPEEGLGSVEGEEVVAAEADAAAVHEAASAGAVNAEQAAEPASDVGDTDTSSPEEGLGSVEGEEVVAAEADAAEVHKAASAGAADAEQAAEPASDVDDTDTSSPEEGLGSVEGEEVVAAEADAAEVHEAASAGAADAEKAADDVSDEPTDTDTDSDTSSPEEGLGSVEGEEVVAAEADAAEVHEAANAGAVNAEQAAEPTSDVDATDTSTPEEGLGSVEGEEVVAAEDDAAAVHEAASDGAANAEQVADDVSDERTDTDTDTDTSSPEEGLGSVEGDEVTKARDDAATVHDAAVTAERQAEQLTPARALRRRLLNRLRR